MRLASVLTGMMLASCSHSAPSADAGPHAGEVSSDRPDAGGAGTAGHASATGGAGSAAAGNAAAGSGSEHWLIPSVYPLVRANTPSALIADAAFRAPGDPSLDVFGDDAGTPPPGGSANSLARVVQERLYTQGPTELLRILHNLDGRTSALDTDSSKHPCLAAAPLTRPYMFPGGQRFDLHLQCAIERDGGWMAFGFAQADEEDAGVSNAHDFYLIEGQDGGMGGAYRIRAGSADVDAWITVADSRVPSGSQVILHLTTNSAAMTTELTFGGSGVGFCSAHLKTGSNYLFVRGKPNAPPPPGSPNGHYCDHERAGCFSVTELNNDLGASSDACMPIRPDTFALHTNLDASFDPEANVMPATIYQFFDHEPAGIPAY